MAALEEQLLKHGYGLFLSRVKDENDQAADKVLRRVSYVDFRDSETEYPIIAAIDNDGKIVKDKVLNFIDVHIIGRNYAGQAVGISGTIIPEKWQKPQLIEFHGRQINLSHPAKVLYHKLNQSRNYDKTDIDRLIETGKITAEDIDDMEKVFADEFEVRMERGKKVFADIAEKLRAEMSAAEIYEVMISHLELQKYRAMAEKPFGELAQKVFESKERSGAAIADMAFKLFRISKENDIKLQEIKRIREKIELE